MPSSLPHRFAWLVAVCTLILIMAGGLVTSTESGLSVPDWPLSYGQFFPPMVGGVRFEHTHRIIAGTVGILTLILWAVFSWKEKRAWVRRLSLTAFGAVVLQAILGGLTVIFLLPSFISIFHACLGQTFFCLVAALAFVTSREWSSNPPLLLSGAGPLQRLALMTTGFVYLQLILGAVLRHTHQGVVWHVMVAFVIVIHALLLCLRIARDPQLSGRLLHTAALLAVLVISQLFLGLGAYIFTQVLEKAAAPRFWEVIIATAHQTTGALVLVTSMLLSIKSLRFYKAVVS